MAPVKSAGRATRSTRAATVAKQNTAATSKKVDTLPAKKTTTSKTTRPTTAARRTRSKDDEPVSDQEDELQLEEAPDQKTVQRSGRSNRTTAKPAVATSAPPPRRRVRVTPLDPPDVVSTPASVELEKPKRVRSTTVSVAKKTSSKASKAAGNVMEVDGEQQKDADTTMKTAGGVSKTRSTRTQQSLTNNIDESQAAPKPRGRAKKLAETEVNLKPKEKLVRSTRTTRAASITSSIAPEAEQNVSEPPVVKPAKTKASNALKKQVTFQDIPEDDKENVPLPTKGKKTTVTRRATNQQTLTNSIRAKPLRKPAAAASATRAQKSAASTKSSETAVGVSKKSTPRALTPKKITQVARAVTNDLEVSDSEDELNHVAQTPVRDLSLSPRRPPTSATANALARSMSPAKKLDFGPSFGINGLDMTEAIGALASPARRLPTSPVKESIQASPKRGLGGVGRLLFSPAKNGDNRTVLTATIAGQGTSGADANLLLQSPKRSGALDLERLFSQSAVKSTKKSPIKASLLGSPAKRSVLFSPSKNAASSLFKNMQTENSGMTGEQDGLEQEDLIEELTATSGQRAIASPLRVHRVSDDELHLDFDESILPVRSPLKVMKPLQEGLPATLAELQEDLFVTQLVADSDLPSSLEQGTFVEPKLLKTQDESCQPDGEQEDDIAEEETQYNALQQSPTRASFPKSPVVKRYREQEAVSEDELATNDTPDHPLPHRKSIRSSMNGNGVRVRQSTGISSIARSNQFGFTPLAAQMEGWKASSSLKRPVSTRRESVNFSPLARQHIDGEIMVSRDNTPVQKMRLLGRNSDDAASTPETTSFKGKTSKAMRKSIAQRESLLVPGQPESPEQNNLFDEEMQTRAEERQIAEHHESVQNPESVDTVEDQEFQNIMHIDDDQAGSPSEEEGDTILIHEYDDESIVMDRIEPSELTTDLINFTHASNTAMVDFQNLAEEADQLASDGILAEEREHDEQEPIDMEPEEDNHSEVAIDKPRLVPSSKTSIVAESPASLYEHELTQMALSPSFEVVDPSFIPIQHTITPSVQRPHLRKFNMNTVVSKVPLRPEGEVSPIKLPKRRALSFGAAGSASRPSKRVSFGQLPDVKPLNSGLQAAEEQTQETQDIEILEAERRMMRTSVAPSPGGTSTPATIKSMRSSFGCTSTATSPGRLSFGVSDFGDSTLDGIELPSDIENDDDIENGQTAKLVASELMQHESDVTSLAPTPLSNKRAASTPTTAKSAYLASSAATPIVNTKFSKIHTDKTPGTARKVSVKTPATGNARGRTPLKPVADGALRGTTIFVDVRTSEGADASEIFIELLSCLGAKCLREWRWNGRASLAVNDITESPNATEPGVTHVVFKDGSPKTLEKVRHATASNFSIFCVGVGWVLDCEKEGKWIDETNYLIDKTVMAKSLATSVGGGKNGSRRRKSMEPSMLVPDGFGSVKRSASRARRSVSAEMLEGARRDLREIATPKTPSTLSQVLQLDDNEEDIENVVTSPSAAFSDEVGPDSPSGAATPTGFVSYDPRTAMTPGAMTPYLVSEGKKLVQMSAPPKQQRGLSIFADPNGGEDNKEDENEATRPAKKFRLSKGNLDKEKRRQTLGGGMKFRPAIGSPLGRELR